MRQIGTKFKFIVLYYTTLYIIVPFSIHWLSRYFPCCRIRFKWSIPLDILALLDQDYCEYLGLCVSTRINFNLQHGHHASMCIVASHASTDVTLYREVLLSVSFSRWALESFHIDVPHSSLRAWHKKIVEHPFSRPFQLRMALANGKCERNFRGHKANQTNKMSASAPRPFIGLGALVYV
jgi:hypothetical protein